MNLANRLFKWTEPSAAKSEMAPQRCSLGDMQIDLLAPNSTHTHLVDSSSLEADLFPPSESDTAVFHSSDNVVGEGGGVLIRS